MFLCFLPSLEVSWLFIWLYLSALGGSGGWVSFSSRQSRLLLDYKEESGELKAPRTAEGNCTCNDALQGVMDAPTLL